MPRPAPSSPLLPSIDDEIKIHLHYLRQHLNYVTQSTIIPPKDMPKKLFVRVRELNKRVVKSDHIDLCVRIDDLLHLSDDKYIDYYTEQLDCFYPMGNQESIIISHILLDILHYEHWNQYYYKNMSDEDLLKIINKGIKQYKVDMKKKDLEKDFQGF